METSGETKKVKMRAGHASGLKEESLLEPEVGVWAYGHRIWTPGLQKKDNKSPLFQATFMVTQPQTPIQLPKGKLGLQSGCTLGQLWSGRRRPSLPSVVSDGFLWAHGLQQLQKKTQNEG